MEINHQKVDLFHHLASLPNNSRLCFTARSPENCFLWLLQSDNIVHHEGLQSCSPFTCICEIMHKISHIERQLRQYLN